MFNNINIASYSYDTAPYVIEAKKPQLILASDKLFSWLASNHIKANDILVVIMKWVSV